MTAPATLPTAEDRIRAALWFAEHGFGVFSVWSASSDGTCRCPKGATCESPGKHPIGGSGGFHNATLDAVKIRTLLSAGSQPNYGLVCPEGVFALDVDGEGLDRLAELEADLGPLPATLRTQTAHGQHVFLRWPERLPRPIGQLFGFVTRWGSGADAGYVIGPRSIHPSGFAYAPAGTTFGVAELPDAWVRSVAAPSRPTLRIIAGGYELPDAVPASASRYEAILSYTAHLYNRSMTVAEMWPLVRDLLAPRFSDGLAEHEVRARFDRAVDKIAARLGEPRTTGTVLVPVGSLIVAPLTEFESAPIQWLWPAWLPRGVVTVMDGNPGVSKSTLVADLAARITTGREWPDGTPQTFAGPQRVLWITTEDDPGRVLRPRIEVAGGAAELALFARSEIVFPGAAAAFRELLVSLAAQPAGLAFVVLDPLFSHIDAKVKSIADAEMRQHVMNPLTSAAEAAAVAILVIRHFNKDTTASSLNRGAGSLGGIVGAARALWTVTIDKEDETGDTKAVGVTKMNYAIPPAALRYHVISKVPEGWVGGNSVSAIEWLGQANVTVDQMNAEDEFTGDAKAALEEILAGGAVSATQVQNLMRPKGYGRDATRRAATRLGVVKSRTGFGPGSASTWSLPDGTIPSGHTVRFSPYSQPDSMEPRAPEAEGARAGSHLDTDSMDGMSTGPDGMGASHTVSSSGPGAAPRARPRARVREARCAACDRLVEVDTVGRLRPHYSSDANLYDAFGVDPCLGSATAAPE